MRQPREGKRENERSYNNKGQGNKGRKKIQCTSDEQGILSLSLSLSRKRGARAGGGPRGDSERGRGRAAGSAAAAHTSWGGFLRFLARRIAPNAHLKGMKPTSHSEALELANANAPLACTALNGPVAGTQAQRAQKSSQDTVVHRQKRDIPFALRAAGAPRVSRDYWLRPWPGPTRPNTTFTPTLDLGPDPLAPGPVGKGPPQPQDPRSPCPKIPDHPQIPTPDTLTFDLTPSHGLYAHLGAW